MFFLMGDFNDTTTCTYDHHTNENTNGLNPHFSMHTDKQSIDYNDTW